ncbi:DNA-binding MarR family transcriptional regulator [Mycolicibacterium sp. BK556]|uniref:MarR family winged helix-turn-helix transcriptional regulator n=1 Tax=Mycobacteriaceae TaxID=1762 RepID=UPI0010600DC6|nr:MULTISPECIES: MarR family winged helix-turn-helix transcriptional regulator [Mycobacteriaceae]MBB3605237.1 DNA-binding MarR family transcriptional regulator [Mycolicibacterium sp. BK556]MBB3635433.1 DNA-binding MarR family transcriptional regulator [Mycolicibacterium sp. BK607]MBB3747773.1 DNA-binding MarR family transcriptional regulator [Mycolicibacterium sp. BK634]TDO08091.1 DNA-binding MarR family transcriptional regulator [Mycobacterium sp. BK086]
MHHDDADSGSSAQWVEDPLPGYEWEPNAGNGFRPAYQRYLSLGFDELEASAWLHFDSVATALQSVVNRGLLHQHKLSLADVQLLSHLKSNGPSQMGVLAEMLMVTPSALTQQTQRLERRRLVSREASSDDGRRVLATITREGVRLTTASLETYARLVRAHFLDDLSRRQMIALGDGCRRISARLRATDSAPDLTDP